MKKLIITIALTQFLCSGLFAQSADIKDYIFPETKANRLNLTFNYNYTDFATKNSGTLVEKYGVFNIQSTNYYSSLPYAWTIDANVSMHNSSNVYDFSSYLNSSFYKYINNDSKFFFEGSEAIAVRKFDLQYDFPVKDEIKLMAGGGYGRVVYATEMGKAIRIDEYLFDEGLLSGHFEKEAVLEIARHIAKENDYKLKFGEKYSIEWFNDLEKILVKTGKLKGGNLNPYTLLRIYEVLNKETIQVRAYGWQVHALGTVQNYDIPDHLSTFGYRLGYNIAYPITNKLQLLHQSNYDRIGSNQHNITSETSLTFELSNLIDLTAKYNLFSFSDNSKLTEYQQINLGILFYIENNIYITASGYYQKNKYPTYWNDFTIDNTTKGFKIDFGYRLPVWN